MTRACSRSRAVTQNRSLPPGLTCVGSPREGVQVAALDLGVRAAEARDRPAVPLYDDRDVVTNPIALKR